MHCSVLAIRACSTGAIGLSSALRAARRHGARWLTDSRRHGHLPPDKPFSRTTRFDSTDFHNMSLPEGSTLSDRTAIVTGGASGIGRAIAVLFAKHGARVAILDLVPGETAQEIEADGGTAVYVACDVTRQSSVGEAFGVVQGRFGPSDILVNSAGIAAIGTVEQTEEADFD